MSTSARRPEVRSSPESITVVWEARGTPLELRLDRVEGSHPRWIGSASDLDETGDRRGAAEVIEVLTEFGTARAESVALFHDDGRLEWLVEPAES